MYLTKVDTLCQYIAHENINIDQALIIYRTKVEQDNHAIEKSKNSILREVKTECFSFWF
jgi:hypothetical protein